MDWILEYSPIFFDFDGLLVNTEHLHFEAYEKMLQNHGVSFPWDFPIFASIAHQSSDGLRKAISNHAPDLVEKSPWEALYAEKKEEYEKLLGGKGLELMPGAKKVLRKVEAARIPRAVVTNSTKKQTDTIREKLPLLSSIPHWITREDYQNPKPAPDGYLRAIEVLGSSDKMLGFEDSLRGIRSLEGAGITPVLICSPDHPQMTELPKGLKVYFSFVSL